MRSNICGSLPLICSYWFYLGRNAPEVLKQFTAQSMAFDYTKDIRSAFFPITLISWFTGIGVIEYPLGHRRIMLSLFYSSMICTLHVTCTFLSYLNHEGINWEMNSLLVNILYGFHYGFFVFTVCSVILVSIVRNKERSRCIMELAEINKIMKEMGVVCSYKRFLVSQIRQFGGLVVMLILTSISLYFSYIRSGYITEGPIFFYKLFSIQYLYFMSTVNEIMFCNFNEMMTGSFEDLNTLLESLKVKHPYDSHNAENNLIQVDVLLRDERKLEILYSVRKIYTRLAHVAKHWNHINAVFILVLVVFSTWTFTNRVHSLYIILSFSGNLPLVRNVFFFDILLVIIFLSWKLLMITRSAVLLSTEARRTRGIVLLHLHPIAALQSEVRTFSMQLTQNPLHFSVFGLCSLDYTMLLQIFQSVSTYSLIFIQSMGLPKIK